MKTIVHYRKKDNIIQSVYRNGEMAFIKCINGAIEEMQPGEPYITDIGDECELIPKIWAETNCIVLPTGYSMESHDDLLVDLREFFKSKILISEDQILLLASYAYYTWFYDKLKTAPYLFILGDYGTGKTRILSLLHNVCFTPVNLGTAVTNANIFRSQNMAKGTILIDEFEKNESSKNDFYAQILNNGYTYPGIILRTESSGKKLTQVPYTSFGPKIISARTLPKDDALLSRCFVIHTKRHTNTELNDNHIPRDLKKEHYAEAEELRNRLLGLRFALAGQKAILESNVEFSTSSPRNEQLLTAMVSVMPKHLQKAVAAVLENLLTGSNSYKNSQIQMDVVAALDSILSRNHPDWENKLPLNISIEEIADTIKNAVKRHYFNRNIGDAARAIGLKTARHNAGVVVKIDSASVLSVLSERILGRMVAD